MPEHGLTEKVLNDTDVLIWWGHCCHADVSDEVVERVKNRVLDGMGFIVLHSGHLCKPFKLLMGTCCRSKWRENDEKERKTGKTKHSDKILLPVEWNVDSTAAAESLRMAGDWTKITK